MIVEDRLVGEEVAAGDRFPVGMRILAVDDDQTCLKVLESLLRKCQYHVTTTTQSIKALEMLRKNRHMFDLVISDVNMPDIDGFKLLEQVGLEMDLPVIMLSEYGDKEWVMKGVIRGACDYLMKPVRIEELRTIWQHVVRKKIDCKDQNKVTTNEEKICNMAGVGGEGMASENIADQNKKVCQKRKEQSEEEEEDGEENGQESEEPSTGKKPRLVWDAELHRKFVAAVNQLGLDKAFPKKILDLMNVEGLTRENVASHLQKYRLSLKKPTKQASMVAALGYSNPYLQMGLLGGYGDLCTSSGSRRILSSTLPSYASGGIFCGLNSPSILNLRGMSSSALVQPVQSQNIRSSIKEAVGNIKLPMFSANQSSNLLQGIQTSSMEVNQFRQNHYPTGIRKLTPSDYSSAFSKVNNYLSCPSSNHLLPQGNSPLTHNSEVYSNHSSVGGAPVKTEYFNPAISGSGFSNIFDYNLNNPLEDAIVRGEVQCQEGLLENIIQASCYPQQHNDTPSITQQAEACFLQRMDSLEGLMNSFMPLDDIICEMVKQDESETKLIDREMEFDAYPAASDSF